jgi:hypothetical protein
VDHGHQRPGPELEVEAEGHVHQNGHHGVEQRGDSLVAELVADLRPDVIHPLDHEVGLGPALGHGRGDPVGHAGGHHLVVLTAPLRGAEVAHLFHSGARGDHCLPNLVGLELLWGAEVDEPVLDIGVEVGDAAQGLQRGPGGYRALGGELGHSTQAEQEAVLGAAADALDAHIVKTGGLGSRTHLVGPDGMVEAQLHHRSAGEVDAEVEAPDGDTHQDAQVEHGGDEERWLALSDEVDVRLVLEDLHRRQTETVRAPRPWTK